MNEILSSPILSLILDPFGWLGTKLPFPIDQIKLGALFALSYPLGILFSKLEGIRLKYYYGLILGLLFQYTVFKENILHTLGVSTTVYIFLIVFQRKCVTPIIVFLALYCSGYHIYRMISNPGVWRINISFALMMIVCKLSAFAWSYRDGGKPENELSQGKIYYSPSLNYGLDQNFRKIVKLPSVLEYYCYVYFFPSTLVGPFFDFVELDNLIKRKGVYEKVPYGKAYISGLISLLIGSVMAMGDGLIARRIDLHYTLTPEFVEHSLLYRLGYVAVVGYFFRCKYYTGFFLAQAGVDACGLSYGGTVDGKPNFKAVLTCDRMVEFTTSYRTALERWNASTQVWLKRNSYNRIIDYQRSKGKKPDLVFATWVTFAISATWHGFYPTYYLTFFGMWSCIESSKYVHKAQGRITKFIPNVILQPLRYITGINSINVLTIGHVLLDLNKCLKFYMTVYYLPIVLNLVVIILLSNSSWIRPEKPKKEEQADQSKDTKATQVDSQQDVKRRNIMDKKSESEGRKLN